MRVWGYAWVQRSPSSTEATALAAIFGVWKELKRWRVGSRDPSNQVQILILKYPILGICHNDAACHGVNS